MKKYFDRLFREDCGLLLEKIREALALKGKMFIVTANPEIFMSAPKDPFVDTLLTDPETTVIADGIGIVKGAKMLGRPLKERIPGVELTAELLKIAAKEGTSVYFFGGAPTTLEALKEVIKNEYPSLKVSGWADGYSKDKDTVFEEIKALSPDIVLVALGVPMQEKLIYKHLKDFDSGIFMGVGGSFDVISKVKARAPKFFINHNLEWLYRILKEPKRIKRFYNNNIKFLFKLIKFKVKA